MPPYELVMKDMDDKIAAAIRSLRLEIVQVGQGHMTTARYYAVLWWGTEKIQVTLIGDDGFNDGDENGMSFTPNRTVPTMGEI